MLLSVFAVNVGRDRTHFDTLPTDSATLGAVGEVVSVFMRLLLSGCVFAGVFKAAIFRFRDDASEAPDSAANADLVDLGL